MEVSGLDFLNNGTVDIGVIHGGCVGRMENKTETTIVGYIGFRVKGSG